MWHFRQQQAPNLELQNTRIQEILQFQFLLHLSHEALPTSQQFPQTPHLYPLTAFASHVLSYLQQKMNRKRDTKKPLDINELQREQLQHESQRYDHEEIDEQNQEFLHAARQKRKLHRKHREVTDLEGESDVDEEFRIGLDQADDKFGVKRKKKHLFNQISEIGVYTKSAIYSIFAKQQRKPHEIIVFFNDGGVPIEPFNIKGDIQEGTLTREGVFKMEREKRKDRAEDDDEEEKDAWLDSIQEDQNKMLFEKSQKQADSDVSESEDELGGDSSGQEDTDKEQAIGDKRKDQAEIQQLKEILITLLDEDSNENANQALKRLRGANQPGPTNTQFAAKKKNIRLKQDGVPTQKEQQPQSLTGDQEQFQKLLNLVTRLQHIGYTDVFKDRREDIAFEVKQHQMKLEREKQRILREEQGWHYKILYKETGLESEVFGPFTQEEMNGWNEGGYFKENDSHFCTFIRVKDFKGKKEEWLLIDDVEKF